MDAFQDKLKGIADEGNSKSERAKDEVVRVKEEAAKLEQAFVDAAKSIINPVFAETKEALADRCQCVTDEREAFLETDYQYTHEVALELGPKQGGPTPIGPAPFPRLSFRLRKYDHKVEVAVDHVRRSRACSPQELQIGDITKEKINAIVTAFVTDILNP